jgi:hypothetical protein
MQLLKQEITQRKSLYVYHVPDTLIINKWGSMENFTKLVVKNEPSALLWLDDVMPNKKGVGKFFTDFSQSVTDKSWDILLPKEEPKTPKKKGKKEA